MARLLLIRHGQPAGTWGGQGSDPGLSEEGRTQAEAAALALGDRGALAIVSSPMLRCRETAAPYARIHGAEPVIESRISEIAAPEGTEDRAGWLQTRFPWRDRAKRVGWPTLEPELHTWREAMLDYAKSVHEDTAVFTHFIAINVLCGAALGVDDTIVCLPGHASITELEVRDGALKLIAFGAAAVLDDVR